MKVRYSLGWVALMVACGGSSKHESTDSGGAAGTGGDTSGASGKGGGEKGGSGGASSLGGTSGTGVGGDVAGLPGAGGSGLGATSGVGGGVPGEICNDDGCFFSDPSVTPITPAGPVHCGGTECATGEACCMASGKCFEPADEGACPRPPDDDDQQGRRPCSSSAHCDPLFFCSIEYGELCSAVGHCQPISNCGECGSSVDADGRNPCRICGCDGNTYPDVQTACRAGAATAYQGAGCGETIEEGGGGAAGSAGSSSAPPRVITPCGTSDDCKRDGESCCAITNRCYPKADPGQCAEPPTGTRFPCTSDAQCRDWEVCVGEGCDTPGGCVARDGGQCGVILDPVCGCDGVTYTSTDCATQSGARVKSEGVCPED